MATTNTRTVARQALLKREPALGWADTLDSSPSGQTYIDQDYRFAVATYGPTRFKDYFVYIPGATGNDILRRGTTLDVSNGRLSVTGAAYSTSQTAYELWSIDPTEVNQALQLAQQQIRQKLLLPLSGGRVASGTGGPHDYDMETTGVAYWDGSSGSSSATNLTPTKSTTDLLYNTQSLKLTASGASGVCLGEKLRCKEGDTFYSAVIARADVGTFGFTWYNSTGAANFTSLDVQTWTGEDYVVIWRLDTVPTGCEEMQPKFTLSGASDIAYVDMLFGPNWNRGTAFFLPSSINDTFEVKALRPTRYATVSSHVMDAYTENFYGDWQQPNDFAVQSLRRDVNSLRIVLNSERQLPQLPVFVSLERDLYKAGETLATESATSSADLDELCAQAFVNIAQNQLLRNPGDASMAALLAKYSRQVAQEELARPPLQVQPQWKHIAPVA